MDETSPSRNAASESPSVIARSGITDDRSRVLNHGETFAVCDHCGDIKTGGLDEEGLYHLGTRHLSQFVLRVDGGRAFFLSSTLRHEDGHLSVALTNHDVLEGARKVITLGTLQLWQTKFVWNATMYQSLRIKNYGRQRLTTEIAWLFFADFADIFEVRGMSRKARGTDLEPEVEGNRVVLRYRGLDEIVRRSTLTFNPPPARLTASAAYLPVTLEPSAELELIVSIACESGTNTLMVPDFETARKLSSDRGSRRAVPAGVIETSNSQVNAWVSRATADLQMLTTDLPTGPYPYAGVPWFNTPFGRDGIITAFECLWWAPDLSRGVLRFLASTQARAFAPEEDAEPGKILHEMRNGEMAALKETPFGRYYGSVDATPLFIFLLHEYYVRTADRALVEELWPNFEAALRWIEVYGDRDRDGFVEYQKQSDGGLLHQAWKDSDDVIYHADGTPAHGPFAVCEVQAYVYAALKAASKLYRLKGNAQRSQQLKVQSQRLRYRFEEAFWCSELSTYAFALDGDKRRCLVRTSNAGQCLFTGIVSPERAKLVADTLMHPKSFSGWGIRTLAEGETGYNPMGYHTGSIWPHDNALIALGLARYGFNDRIVPILSGLFEASVHFDLQRMPELFCGFPRDASDGPVLYPVACSPQAWAAGSVFLLLQACIGLHIDAPTRTLRFRQPHLPVNLDWVELRRLRIQDAVVDVVLERHADDVGVNVLRREGNLRTVVEK